MPRANASVRECGFMSALFLHTSTHVVLDIALESFWTMANCTLHDCKLSSAKLCVVVCSSKYFGIVFPFKKMVYLLSVILFFHSLSHTHTPFILPSIVDWNSISKRITINGSSDFGWPTGSTSLNVWIQRNSVSFSSADLACEKPKIHRKEREIGIKNEIIGQTLLVIIHGPFAKRYVPSEKLQQLVEPKRDQYTFIKTIQFHSENGAKWKLGQHKKEIEQRKFSIF